MLHDKIVSIKKLIQEASESSDQKSITENLNAALEELEMLEPVAEQVDEVNPYDVDVKDWCEELSRMLEELD